jgi:hypothetical protein
LPLILPLWLNLDTFGSIARIDRNIIAFGHVIEVFCTRFSTTPEI